MFSVTWLKHLGAQDWCASVTQHAAGSGSPENTFQGPDKWDLFLQSVLSERSTHGARHALPMGELCWPVTCLSGDVLETLSLEKLKIGLGTAQENMGGGGMSPMLATGMSYASGRLLPPYIPGTLTGHDSPNCGMGFYFQHSLLAQESFWLYWGPEVCRES